MATEHIDTVGTETRSLYNPGDTVYIDFRGHYILGKIKHPTQGYKDFMDIVLEDKTQLVDVPVAWLQKNSPAGEEKIATTLKDLDEIKLEGRFEYVKIQQVIRSTKASLTDALRYIGQPGGGKRDKKILVLPYDKMMEQALAVSPAIAEFNSKKREEPAPKIVQQTTTPDEGTGEA